MLVLTPILRLLLALLVLASTTHGQAAGLDPINDFCSLSGHMMAVDGDMLYIVGGWMLYKSNSRFNGRNPVIRSLNISKSFQTSLDSVNYIRTDSLPDSVPGLSAATWWPTSENTINLALGRYYMANSTIFGKRDLPDEDRRWSYSTVTRNWTEEAITLEGWQTNSSMRVSSGMTRWIPKLKKGFMFGGVFNALSSTRVVESYEHGGLIVYDAAANAWTNTSTPVGAISEGGMVHLTTATDEVLIQFGGRTGTLTVVEPLSEIHIYSINQSKWFTHSLDSGTVPTPRFSFCTAVKSAPDGSSHQIYMFSGLEAPTSGATVKNGPTTTSLWVLTVPTFEWIQLPYKAKSTTTDPKGRIASSCTTIGEHYIFYYGGRCTESYFGPLSCDKKANAAFLFDLNTLTWTDQYVPNQGRYEIPKNVYDVIGGNKDGGATRMTPTDGFQDPSLSTILSFAVTSATSTSTPGSGNSTASSTPGSPDSNSNPTPVAAIAGGVAGGVVVFAVVGLAIFLWRRPRPKPLGYNPADPKTLLPNGDDPDGGRKATSPTELLVQPPELGGERVHMVELPSHDVAWEMPVRP